MKVTICLYCRTPLRLTPDGWEDRYGPGHLCWGDPEEDRNEGHPHVPSNSMMREADPRNDPDDAYAVFALMPQGEWMGLLASLASGGVLTPAEQVGLKRAVDYRARQFEMGTHR